MTAAVLNKAVALIVIADVTDDMDAASVSTPRQFCDHPSSLSRRSYYTTNICNERCPLPGLSSSAVKDVAPDLQNAPASLRNTVTDLQNMTAGPAMIAAGRSFTYRPQQFDVQPFDFDQVRPNAVLRHGPRSGCVPGICDGLRPAWLELPSPLPNRSLALPHCAFTTKGPPRFMCLEPQCRVRQCLPHASVAGKAHAAPSLVVQPTTNQGIIRQPASSMEYISRPVAAGTSDVSCPVTDCYSCTACPMTVGSSRPMTFGNIDISRPLPANGIYISCPATNSSAVHPAHMPQIPHNVSYRSHLSPSPVHYWDQAERRRSQQDMPMMQWSPRPTYAASKMPHTVEAVSQYGAQESTEYSSVVSDHASYRYQSVRRETRYFVPSMEHPSHIVPQVCVTRPSLAVDGVPPSTTVGTLHQAGYLHKQINPANSQLLQHSSASQGTSLKDLLQSSDVNEPVSAADRIGTRDAASERTWMGDQLNSLNNQPMAIATGGVDNSPTNPCGTEAVPANVEEEEMDILAKATEGLFSPSDGEHLMAEDDGLEAGQLFETQELMMENDHEVATEQPSQWHVHDGDNASENNIVDRTESAVYCEPVSMSLITDGLFVEHVEQSNREFHASVFHADVEPCAENGSVLTGDNTNDDGAGKTRIFSENTIIGIEQAELDDICERREAEPHTSSSVLIETFEKVRSYAGSQEAAVDTGTNNYETVDQNSSTGSEEKSENMSMNHTIVADDSSSYKITFAESELYDMVDKIEKMDPCAQPKHHRKRPVCSEELIATAKRSRKLLRSDYDGVTAADKGVVYHVPENNFGNEEISNENSKLPNLDCYPCTTVCRSVSVNNSALQQNSSCISVCSRDDSVGSFSISMEHKNKLTETQIETNEKFDIDGRNSSQTDITTHPVCHGPCVTPTQPDCSVSTTGKHENRPTMAQIEVDKTYDADGHILLQTNTQPVCHEATQPKYSVTTHFTQPACCTSAVDISVSPSQSICQVATCRQTVSATDVLVTATSLQFPETATTHQLCSVTAPDTHRIQSVCPVSATATTFTSIQPVCPVTASDAPNMPTVPVCTMLTTNATKTQLECTEIGSSVYSNTDVYFSEQGQNRQENGGSRNCFEFLFGLTAQHPKCSSTQSDSRCCLAVNGHKSAVCPLPGHGDS